MKPIDWGVYSAVRLDSQMRPRGPLLARAPCQPGGAVPPEISALWRPGEVAICWNTNEPAVIRKLSAEAKAKRAATRKRNKLIRHYPLIASLLTD